MSRTRKVLDTEKLAVAVRTKRGSRSFRQTAKEAGLDESLLQRTERQENRPNMENLFLLCDWLDVPVEYFLTEREDNHTRAPAA